MVQETKTVSLKDLINKNVESDCRIKTIEINEHGLVISIKDFCKNLFEYKVLTESEKNNLTFKMNTAILKKAYLAYKSGGVYNFDVPIILEFDDLYADWTFFKISFDLIPQKCRKNEHFNKLNRIIDDNFHDAEFEKYFIKTVI